MKYLEDADLTLFQGDVSEVLRSLDAESVHCVVTSPPYWGLRDYGTGVWDGGNPDCDHLMSSGQRQDVGREKVDGFNGPVNAGLSDRYYGADCGKCGARRVDSQLGLEPTPDLYLESMVAVFREVRRVLRADGTCWLNIGDSYAASNNTGGTNSIQGAPSRVAVMNDHKRPVPPGLKPKDLCMIPARLALALQADGWWLRSQIVWSKPNPMPESVTDRPTSSYELVYLLTKSPRYFFDAEAVRETATPEGIARESRSRLSSYDAPGQTPQRRGPSNGEWINAGRNVRNVWEIATQPYPEAHFATYPEELVRRCVLAGTSERGCCPECGAPWEREFERENPSGTVADPIMAKSLGGNQTSASLHRNGGGVYSSVRTTSWLPSCECSKGFPLEAAEKVAIPCTVLDPFFGSGTTGLVARKHGRRTVGIELSADYCALAARRLAQLSLLSEVNRVV